VLENVPAFAEVARGDDRSTCEDICECLKRLRYEASVVELDLAAWTQASSKRIFVVCVDTMGSLVVPPILPLTTIPARVKAFAEHVEKQVESLPKMQLSSFFVIPGSPEWMQHVGVLQTTSAGVDMDDGHDEEGDACWQRQANGVRQTWARHGKLHTDTNPWTHPARGPRPSLRGLPTPVSQRKYELLNLGFLWSAYQRNLSPISETLRTNIAEDLILDLSQNPCRQPWTYGLKRLCRNSRPYSYSLDRMITPYEAFRIYGWLHPNLSSISTRDA